jgi:hypothetical protein
MRAEKRQGTERAAMLALCALAGVVALAAFSAGCAGGEPEAGEWSPEELGRLGGRIHAEPERADEILAEAGLTGEQLEVRVREVTADPDAARAYAEAFRAVSGEDPEEGP